MQQPASDPPTYSAKAVRCGAATEVHAVSAVEQWNSGEHTHVAQVRVARPDLGAVLVVERHAPEPVVFSLSRGVELVPQRV